MVLSLIGFIYTERLSMRNSMLLASAVAITLANGLPANGQEAINSIGWYKACSDQGENKICNVQYQAVASTGQVITSVNLAKISGNIKNEVFQITVPTGRLVPPGLRLKIGAGEEKKIAFAFCTPRICAAELKLDDNLINSLKAGSEITLVSTNWQGKENPLQVSLDGFTAAYDGDAITAEDLAGRQKSLSEQLGERAKSTLDKIKEAQEKARTGGASEDAQQSTEN